MNRLLDTATLGLSGVVANSAMNRERVCIGKNSYTRELSFDPIDFLNSRLETQGQAAWLDLCCGRGRALIEAAEALAPYSSSSNLQLLGVDLVAMFDSYPPGLSSVRLLESSVSSWRPDCLFDLITCVHGLHYVGDKLGLIQNAVSWLKENGVFLANLDPDNLKFPDGGNAGNKVIRDLRKIGFDYQASKHLIVCEGRKDFTLNYRYLGADDTAGPNYTGQAAVNSHYERLEV
ncbi:MAG TPA: methyltransferase domain-containing protein [Blastocatellia bacterium]|nr:methyltransferase domain-containing protein [Blastocatellia bacterium]